MKFLIMILFSGLAFGQEKSLCDDGRSQVKVVDEFKNPIDGSLRCSLETKNRQYSCACPALVDGYDLEQKQCKQIDPDPCSTDTKTYLTVCSYIPQ